MLRIHCDTVERTVVISRGKGGCGRTHMQIYTPQREEETFWAHGTPMNRVDVERGVFQRENMEYLTGEYEAFLYAGDDQEKTLLRVSMECKDLSSCDREGVSERFRKSFYSWKPSLQKKQEENLFEIGFNFVPPKGLELSRLPGRPKRFVDRR
ncbi:hypothetical protein [Methanoregula sp.]|uniref:hypothetical protein n=1 Tax=Methanoregula sp. TaxID=2052170 RepID=UPI0025E53C02|nr:hypothetical protein [Methanoregula sp.]